MSAQIDPRNVAAGNLSVSILATIAVALRLLARRVQKVALGCDDYFILLALVRPHIRTD